VAFLQQWRQPTSFTMESPEGISRTLKTVVANDPERFALSSLLFTKADPTYIRGILSGFREALKAGKRFEWEPVLRLMDWVVKQDREISARKTENIEDGDPNWGWTRMEIARLLENALNDDKNPIEPYYHTIVWRIIEPVTNDPDPSSADEGRSSMDPATNSLNTTRGVAFHTLITYALWRKRNLIAEGEGKKIGFDKMPEVRKVLDDHLDTQIEPTLTIRSVYGWYFANLLYLDRDWAFSNKDRIFPKSDNERSLWDAAWDGLISFSRPNANLFQNLQVEYQVAVSRMNKVTKEVGWKINTGEKLAEHLMVYYAWGALGLTSSMMEDFWNKADVTFKSHALHFVGRSTKSAPADLVKKFQVLWEGRLAKAVTSSKETQHTEEIKAFGWWFASGAFPDEWSLDQLDQLMELTNEIDGNHFVLERLATLSAKYPFQTVRLLGKLLEDQLPWKIIGAREEIETVLKNVLAVHDNNASRTADEFINRLAAKGYTDFTHLLFE